MINNGKDGMARMMITEMAGSPKDVRVATEQRQGIFESRTENLF